MQISRLEQCRLSIFERAIVWLDRRASRRLAASRPVAHLMTGLRGEDAAYFCLRRMGYTIVARRWRSVRLRGDIDLIGWDDQTLCFIEVKTRSSRTFQPAEAAVDEEKRKMLVRMAQEYLRQMEDPHRIAVRFDVVSLYIIDGPPAFEIFRGAFTR